MKISFELSEQDIKNAIIAYVHKMKSIEVKNVYLKHHNADTRDPRETSYFSATVSE